MALLLMRISAALLLAPCLAALSPVPPLAWLMFGLAAVALVCGLLARVAAAAVAVLAAYAAAKLGWRAGGLFALHAIDAAALCLLGAGAYSIDARLYGRRIIKFDP